MKMKTWVMALAASAALTGAGVCSPDDRAGISVREEPAPRSFEEELAEGRARLLSRLPDMRMRRIQERADRKLDSGDVAGARKDVDLLLAEEALDPHVRARVSGGRGALSLMLGDFEQAVRDLDAYIRDAQGRASPDPGERSFLSYCFFNKGYALLRSGRTEEALALADKALELAPRAATLHLGRSKMLNKLTRYADAAKAYERAVALDPRLKGDPKVCGPLAENGLRTASCPDRS